MLLHFIGVDALEIYKIMNISADDKRAVKIMEKYKDFCIPKSNKIIDRYLFFGHRKCSNETLN